MVGKLEIIVLVLFALIFGAACGNETAEEMQSDARPTVAPDDTTVSTATSEPTDEPVITLAPTITEPVPPTGTTGSDIDERVDPPVASVPLEGLPTAFPLATLPWDDVDGDWVLAVVHGQGDYPEIAQGVYLINPAGERWIVAFEKTEPTSVWTEVRDWSPDLREALITTEGPRDLVGLDVLDVQTGSWSGAIARIGGGYEVAGSFGRGDGRQLVSVEFDFERSKSLVERTRNGEMVATFATVPAADKLEWIHTPDREALVTFDDFEVGGSRGHITSWTVRDGSGETVRLAACSPIRWLRTNELIVACAPDQDLYSNSLWVLPVDGAAPWPLTNEGLLPAEPQDLVISGQHLIFETADGLTFVGADDQMAVPLDFAAGTDLIGGITDDRIIVLHDGVLTVESITGSESAQLITGVRSAVMPNPPPLTTQRFPSSTLGGPTVFTSGPTSGTRLDVVGVAGDDVLNFRAAPDPSAQIVATAAPQAEFPAAPNPTITATGFGQLHGDEVWWRVDVDGTEAWANSRFLGILGATRNIFAELSADLTSAEAATIEELAIAIGAVRMDVGTPRVTVIEFFGHDSITSEATFDVTGPGRADSKGERIRMILRNLRDSEAITFIGFEVIDAASTAICERGISANGSCR